MELHSNSIETSTTDLLHRILSDEPGEMFIVHPEKEVVEALCEVMREMDTPPKIRLLAHESVLKDIRRNYRTASAAADLIENGALSIRTTGETPTNSLVVTDEKIVALVSTGTQIAGLVTD